MTLEFERASSGSERGTPDHLVVEIGSWASRVTLDIIGVAGMGHDFGAIKDPNNKINEAYRSVVKPSRQGKMLAIASLVLPAWLIQALPVAHNNNIHTAAEVIKNTCRELIRRKTERFEQEKNIEVDILSVALTSGGFSKSNLVDQTMTFLAAGSETTATALLWAVYLLCRSPEAQCRLRAEIRANLASIDDDTAQITASDIDQLQFLHAVCMETLRLYPPAPVTIRVAAHDTTILDQRVPAGTNIILAPWAVNRSTALWGPDALEFKPDRWMGPGRANTEGGPRNYRFLTFLHGPRSCIGQGFAKAEFACLLAALVGRFEMELTEKDPKIKIRDGLTAKPQNGLNVRLKVVEGW